jgi:hypothetical protein
MRRTKKNEQADFEKEELEKADQYRTLDDEERRGGER